MILHRKIKIFLKLIPVILLLSFVYVSISKSMDQQTSTPLAGTRAGSSPDPASLPQESYINDGLSLDEIRDRIWQANMGEKVHNTGSFNSSLVTAVIAIQVHDRVNYLRGLIQSLSSVKGINSTILIFSHDVYDQEINHLIAGIKFAPVTQIFYPFSIQLSPASFPGHDPRDCPRDISREHAESSKCLNAKFPDTYGHYREAAYTQTKHHWFWKGNHIFNRMRLTRNFTGPVIFLEEDHFVAPDMLHFLRLMMHFREK